jgi:hypothetical protein
MKSLLDNWNPDDTTVPPYHFNSLCYFDYQTEYQQALNYRNAEVPFLVYNVPEIDEVVERWSNLDYLLTKIGFEKYPTETSLDNHFMYFAPPEEKDRPGLTDSQGKPWVEPTKEVMMSFTKWLELAVFNHFKPLKRRKHAYFRISANAPDHWLFDELPFFQPKESLFMVDPSQQAGIHCRFGMNRSAIRHTPSLSVFLDLSLSLSLSLLVLVASSQKVTLTPLETMPSPSPVCVDGS